MDSQSYRYLYDKNLKYYIRTEMCMTKPYTNMNSNSYRYVRDKNLYQYGQSFVQNFLPRIFFGKMKPIPPVVGALIMLLLKTTGLVIQNSMISANDKYNSQLHASCKMIGAVMGKQMFSTSDHIRPSKGERGYRNKDQDIENGMKIQEIISDQGAFEKRLFLRGKHTGSCLRVRGTMVISAVILRF